MSKTPSPKKKAPKADRAEPPAKGLKQPAKAKAKALAKAHRKAQAPGAAQTALAVPAEAASLTDDGLFQNLHLLETSRTKWQYGDWDHLMALGERGIAHHPDRAKLALMIAAGYAHAGQTDNTALFVRLAAEWGCSKTLIAQVLISSVHNSLGRLAVAVEDPEAGPVHFQAAIHLVEPRADAQLIGRTRRIHETARMGLLPEAKALIGEDLALAKAAPADYAARLDSLAVEVELLHSELSLSLRRGQLYNDPATPDTAEARPGPGDQGYEKQLMKKAVSQLGQDLWVIKRMNYARGGYFVEFGATDGVVLSNTFLLEKEFGWTGLLAEPNPKFFDKLQKNRSCTLSTACIGATTGEEVTFILADVYGGIADFADADLNKARRDPYRLKGDVIQLTTISLHDFLLEHNAPKVIDYLSIDTEGSEFVILEAFPFDQWTVRLITVEHNYTPMREQLRVLLEGKGYQRTQMQFDDWYALKT